MTRAAARRALAVGVLSLLASSACDAGQAYDHRAYGKAFAQIDAAIRGTDFAALDAMYERFSSPLARARDGTWMLQAFPAAFHAVFTSMPAGEIDETFAEWKRRDAGSLLRPVAEAFARQSRAWYAKGRGCYAGIPSASRKTFDALVGKAAEALRAGGADSTGSVLWYQAAILVAGGQGRPAAELDALLAEAVTRFPGYEPLYAARMTFLLPAWGGSFEAVDRFVRDAAHTTQPLEGRALYAWLYLDLAAESGCEHLFENSLVSWDEMKPAFDDMLSRHPDPWNLNVFATFACRARDAVVTARLLGQLGGDARLGAWSQGLSTESCRRMVHEANLQVRREDQEPASAFR